MENMGNFYCCVLDNNIRETSFKNVNYSGFLHGEIFSDLPSNEGRENKLLQKALEIRLKQGFKSVVCRSTEVPETI